MEPLSTTNTELITQGKAQIYTKYITKDEKNKLVQNQVFYNPIQVFNRDMTLLVMQHYIDLLKQQKKQHQFDGVRIVDALSASGLRTIRFLKELNGVKQVYANDISQASHKLMADNFKLNNLNQSKIKMTIQDANVLLRQSKLNYTFDIVDLDPYGSVVPFLQSSIQSIRDGGLLCATCTDTRVTCGPDLHKCYYYYGTTRAQVQCFQQNALRIVLNTINTIANKHCRYVQPIISFQTQFYLRVFVRIHRNKTQCANSGLKIGTVYNCNSCGNYQYQTLFTKKQGKDRPKPSKLLVSSNNCSVCKQSYFLNSPIWLAPINNNVLAQKMLTFMENYKLTQQNNIVFKTHKQMYGMLYAIVNQKQLSQVPLGFNVQMMSKNIRAQVPPKKVLMAAMQSLGHRLVGSYIHDGLYKTTASAAIIYDVIKSWKILKTGQQSLKLNVNKQFGLKILERPIEHKPNFDHELKQPYVHVPQFFPHQQKGMGPKGKALKRVLQQQDTKKQINENEKVQNQSLNK